jgi:hypothetical protein
MATKPNFTDARIIGDVVRVEGRSDPADPDLADILDIRVTLVQGERMASRSVEQISEVWHAELPVSDAATPGEFRAGEEAVAFGVEARKENLLTMTWTETVTVA